MTEATIRRACADKGLDETATKAKIDEFNAAETPGRKHQVYLSLLPTPEKGSPAVKSANKKGVIPDAR